ncbi:MAG TPA: hypothetical protein VNH15_06535 [Elusimicrobiota bacterium]|nr:hypothetical protein [Elusimicrobiota bacterium]
MATAISSAPAPSPVLTGPILDAPGQMGLDEAVLDLSAPQDAVLRFYRWDGPAITFGYGQRRAHAVQLSAARGFLPRPPVRRPTGGGVVFHDGDMTFSLVFPWNRLSSPLAVYQDLHAALAKALRGSGGPAALWTGQGPEMPLQKACFAAPSPADLVDHAGRKILGGALRKRRGRGLYQASLRQEFFSAPRQDLEALVTRALRPLLARPLVPELPSSWIWAGRTLAEKYRSESWNARR